MVGSASGLGSPGRVPRRAVAAGPDIRGTAGTRHGTPDDIQIYMCKQFRKRQIVTDVAGLIIFKNRKVLYTVSTEVIIACPMKFAAYPLDHQTCKFLVIRLFCKLCTTSE